MCLKTYRTTKVTNERDVTVLRKNFLQMHATNNHSDIIFLSVKISADGVPVGCLTAGRFTEKPDSAVSGRSCCSAASQCIHPHCTTVSPWSGQHLLSANLIKYLFLFLKYHNVFKTIRISCYNAQFEIMYRNGLRVFAAILWSRTGSAQLRQRLKV